MSPTQRSLAYLKGKGAHAAITEHWNTFAQIRMDLFKWIDIVAIQDGQFVGVQTSTGSNAAARVDKARGNPALQAWLNAGGALVVHSWAKRGGRGERKLWSLKERHLTAADLSVNQVFDDA